jgi:NADH-quinone oxidoreductase subunit J
MSGLINIGTVLAYVALISLLLIILAPTPLHMVFFGLLFYFAFGWLFVVSGYDFLGIDLIILYAGALMGMFLFVVMVFDLSRTDVREPRTLRYWWRSCFVLFVFSLSLFGVSTVVFSFCAGDALSFFWQRSFSFSLYTPAVFMSLLTSLATTFYQEWATALLLYSIVLVIGLIGAIGITCGSPILPFRRRLSRTARSRFVRYRTIVLC